MWRTVPPAIRRKRIYFCGKPSVKNGINKQYASATRAFIHLRVVRTEREVVVVTDAYERRRENRFDGFFKGEKKKTRVHRKVATGGLGRVARASVTSRGGW